MPSAEYHKIQVIQEQEELDMIYQTINNFKMPYKYFKKLNILPLDIVEGEIHKYFDITTLLLENFSEAKHISHGCLRLIFEQIGIHEDLKPNLLKYYNNFPSELFNNYYIDDYIMNNYKKYKEANVITPIIDNQIREELDNIINNKTISITNTIIYQTQQLIEAEERELNNNKYKIPVRRFPHNSKLLITGNYDSYYCEIIIVKVCKKIIKYENRYNPVVRQIKITQLEDILDGEDYKLVDRFDRQKCYCLDDDDNIYLGH